MKRIIFFLLVIPLLLFPLFSAKTAGLVPCGGPDEPECEFCHFFELFDGIVDFFILPPPDGGGIIPGIAVLMIIIVGFRFYFAQGDPSRLKQAQSMLVTVVIGLFLIYGAWIIVNTFFAAIGVSGWTGLGEGGWSAINCL